MTPQGFNQVINMIWFTYKSSLWLRSGECHVGEQEGKREDQPGGYSNLSNLGDRWWQEWKPRSVGGLGIYFGDKTSRTCRWI